jgi:uncharacterized membrane protein
MSAASLIRQVARQTDWWFDGPLLSPLRQIGAGLLVAAGPWILAIVTLTLIGAATEPRLGAVVLEDMRLAIVYAFMLGPIVAAPAGVIAARAVTDAVGTGAEVPVGAILLIAAGIAGIGAEALAATVALIFGLTDPGLALAFAVLTAVSAMMWTAFPVLTACRARYRLIVAFAVGMAAALGLSLAVAGIARSGADVVWCFTTGIALCFALCVVPLDPAALTPAALRDAARGLGGAGRSAWPLALGASLAIAGVWADKWVAWAWTGGQVSAAGFRHLPAYDSALFLAQLSVLPGLAAIAMFYEGPVRAAMARFRSELTRGTSLYGAERAVGVVAARFWTGLGRITVAQAALSAALILASPALAAAGGLRLDQLLLLRTGIAGAFLHMILLAASGVLILANRKAAFAAAQAAFLGFNLALSAALAAGGHLSALGFAGAAALAAALTVVLAMQTVRELLRHVFLSGNDGLFRSD